MSAKLTPTNFPVIVGETVLFGNSSRTAIKLGLATLTHVAHARAVSAGWWSDKSTGKPLERNKGELLMLMVSELSEGFEGLRKNLMDDKLTNRPMIEVEFADCLIRMCDFAGRYGLDIGGAACDKIDFNEIRTDHKLENRNK